MACMFCDLPLEQCTCGQEGKRRVEAAMAGTLFENPPKVVEPDICRRKHGGNPESEEANKKVNKAKWARLSYYFVLGRGEYGSTADEAAEHYGVSHNTVAPRFSELKLAGGLYKSGKQRMTRAGGMAHVLLAKPGFIVASDEEESVA